MASLEKPGAFAEEEATQSRKRRPRLGQLGPGRIISNRSRQSPLILIKKKQILPKTKKSVIPLALLMIGFLRCHQYCIPWLGEARIFTALDRSAQARYRGCLRI